MRFPAPAAMLVEHPAVPVPMIEANATESAPRGEVVARSNLTRSERYRLAVQLTAVSSLLAEFDLWPGQAAIRNAAFYRTNDGLTATLSRFPVSHSHVFARLGSGQAAAETMRRAVMGAISEAVDLPVSSIDVDLGEPGFFLDGAVKRQLHALPIPLDRATARSLWALRWDGLPLPETGVATFWRVPHQRLARRLASALWAALGRSGESAWLWPAGRDDMGTAPSPALGKGGVLIVAGSVSTDELAAVSRWAQRPGCAAVAIGSFPHGWHPPTAPGVDSGRLSRHLAVTGTAPDQSRLIVERRVDRFDPFDPGDREELIRCARYRFGNPPLSEGVARQQTSSQRLQEMLLLAPDGLPPGFISVHSGLSAGEIAEAANGLSLIETEDRWRLPHVCPLETNPRHLEVARLFSSSDPRRVLHEALGSGDTAEILRWARERLDNLDGTAVRDLLATIAPGTLGPEVQSLMAEACLTILDLTGARNSIAVLDETRKRVFELWLAGLDKAPTTRLEMASEDDSKIEPRAACEAALKVLQQANRGLGGDPALVRQSINNLLPELSDSIQRRIEIERVFIQDPDRFADRSWRRQVTNGHPALKALMMHRRAFRLTDTSPRTAGRIFRRLLVEDIGPGLSGVLELDIGMAAIADGDSRSAEIHQFRAYRLLQAAGFKHAIRRVLFNLAVTDLDHLRIDRASERLLGLAEDEPSSPYILGEMCRLALARGDDEEFNRRLSEYGKSSYRGVPDLEEGLSFLRGVAHLLGNNYPAARKYLAEGGQESAAWLEVLAGLSGKPVTEKDIDGWGVIAAAHLIAGDSTPMGPTTGSTREAFSLALADRLARDRIGIDGSTRAEAVRVLDSIGARGWADRLRGNSDGSVVPALATIVEQGSFEDVGEESQARLLQSLGLTGLEINDSRSAKPIWKIGSGVAGTEIRHGRISIVPFGGEVTNTPEWTLTAALFDLFAPAPADHHDPRVEDTGFVGISPPAVEVRRQLFALGPSHLPILILGETGVGKEIAARAIHRLSGRDGAFVAVNMNAIPANLLEAELFGSLKGAFTGADRSRRGLVTAADGGTLFLDEIGDLDPPIQIKLLRFLESQEVRPVGSDHNVQVDVRIVSATHRDLARRVQENVFRSDLFYRLGGTTLEIPPLRERRRDIPDLREHFEGLAVAHHGLRPARWSSEAMDSLQQYHWPGNVREFRHVIEVALVRAAGGSIRADDLPIEKTGGASPKAWDVAQREFRSQYLEAALRRNSGNRSATARELGISRQALLYHLRNLGLTHILKG